MVGTLTLLELHRLILRAPHPHLRPLQHLCLHHTKRSSVFDLFESVSDEISPHARTHYNLLESPTKQCRSLYGLVLAYFCVWRYMKRCCIFLYGESVVITLDHRFGRGNAPGTPHVIIFLHHRGIKRRKAAADSPLLDLNIVIMRHIKRRTPRRCEDSPTRDLKTAGSSLTDGGRSSRRWKSLENLWSPARGKFQL